MKSLWRETALGDEVEILTGFPFKSSSYIDGPDGIRLLRGDNVVQGALRWEGVKRWPLQAAPDLKRYHLQEGDVVLAMDRPWIDAGLKYAALSSHDLPALLVQRVSRLRGGPNLDTRFLRYLIGSKAFTDHVLAVQTGTAVPHISAGQIRSFRFRCPPLAQQLSIADILGTLDDKIELNHRTNETLEAIARALFKSWFVDFEPVRAKADIRAQHPKWTNAQVSRAALPNLDPEVAELFPDDFQDSSLGSIPVGWEVGTNADLFQIDKTTVKPNEHPTEAFDHYSIPAYDQARQPTVETGDKILSNKFLVSGGSVLLTKLNPRIRRVWLPFPTEDCRSICSTEFLVLKPTTSIPNAFLYSHVSSDPFFDVYQTMVTGTSGSHQRIKPEHLVAMQAALPPSHMVQVYGKIAAGIFEQSETLRVQAVELASTRDALLPRLLSGELEVQVPCQ